MKKKTVYSMLACMFLLGIVASCSNEIPTPDVLPSVYQKSYISMFIRCDSLDISSYGGITIDKERKIIYRNDIYTSSENIAINVDATKPAYNRYSGYPTNIYYPVPYIGSTDVLFSNGDNPNDHYYQERQTGYERYIEEVGDTVFDRTIRWSDFKPEVIATCIPLKNVVITADKSFGSNLTPGVDLSPLFDIAFDDVHATIKSGYTAAPDTYRYRPENYDDKYLKNGPMSFRCISLFAANLEDYSFTKAQWEFYLTVKPERTDTYTFHVKLTFADGTVLEDDAPPVAVKGKDS